MSVYDIHGLKASSSTFGHVREGVWGQLLGSDPQTVKVREIVEDGLCVHLGEGRSTLFWVDKWCSCGPLKLMFPRLFLLSVQQHSFVCQMGAWVDHLWVWDLRWRRRLYDWEVEDVGKLEDILVMQSLRQGCGDRISWQFTDLPSFPMKSIMERLYDGVVPLLSKSVVSRVWCKFYPPRVQLTLWLACLGRLKTRDRLVALGVLDAQQAVCPFCQSDSESNSHVLFSCGFSWRVWMIILREWGIQGVFSSRCDSLIVEWDG